MAQVTWIGEENDGLEESTGFKGIVFKKGEAVEINDPAILETASQNRFFKVTGYEPDEPETTKREWPKI